MTTNFSRIEGFARVVGNDGYFSQQLHQDVPGEEGVAECASAGHGVEEVQQEDLPGGRHRVKVGEPHVFRRVWNVRTSIRLFAESRRQGDAGLRTKSAGVPFYG